MPPLSLLRGLLAVPRGVWAIGYVWSGRHIHG